MGMTREEAIEILSDKVKPCLSGTDWNDAIDMAIKALEQESTIRNCFVCKYSKNNHNAGTEECHLCMWENQYTPTTKNDLGVDCISRDEVCRYVAEFVNHEFSTKGEEELIDNIITGIERMPSVTPQEPILDKIRAEIIEDCGYSKDYVGAFTYSTIKLKTVLQIIDKYKAKVEPQESEKV